MPRSEPLEFSPTYLLGSGGFGKVYDAGDGTVFKVARDGVARADETLQREAAALTVLRGVRGVMPILDWGVLDGVPALRMPKVDHRTMEGTELPFPHCLAVWLLVAQAVLEGHSRGILHRDIKPENIFLTPNGPVLFDYGLCYIMGQPDISDIEDYVFGHPNNIPPEEVTGGPKPTPSPAYDIYQLGVLLHCVVESEYPIPGRNAREVGQNLVRGVVYPIRDEMVEARRLLMDARDVDAGAEAVLEVFQNHINLVSLTG